MFGMLKYNLTAEIYIYNYAKVMLYIYVCRVTYLNNLEVKLIEKI